MRHRSQAVAEFAAEHQLNYREMLDHSKPARRFVYAISFPEDNTPVAMLFLLRFGNEII
jgi:hypothetical protein